MDLSLYKNQNFLINQNLCKGDIMAEFTLDVPGIEKDVETIAERDVYEIKSVLSNI